MQSPIEGPYRNMRPLRFPARIIVGISITALLYAIIFYGPSYHAYENSQSYEQAGNTTLGFEKILVVGLKDRTDRRDAMALQASVTSLDIDFVDGVKGETVTDKALPYGRDRDISGGNASVGSWRGHIDAIRSILDNHLSSALIMEDDVDWDIRIKSQMIEFAEGVRSVSRIQLHETQLSPYGDDWDILWPGHCGEILPESEEKMNLYVISNDETVAPKAHQPWLKALASYPEQTRIVHTAGAPLCTFGYAVSYKGAEKIIAQMGIKGSNYKFDNSLSNFCKDKELGARCVSVQPMLFYHHRAAGSGKKDSDIEASDAAVREQGITENIVWSTRLNLENLVVGNEDWVMQW